MTKEKDKQPVTQDDTQESEEQDPQPTEPTQAEYDANPAESQEAPDAGVSNLAPGSIAGTPEPESSGLDVPGSWRGVDEPGEVGAEEDSEAAEDGQEN